MTQNEKELLLKDLCARLPYGVKIALKNNGAYHHENIAKKGDITIEILKGFNGNYFSIRHTNPLDWDWYDDDIDIEDIKPYLFPLSSMTEEQIQEYTYIVNYISSDDTENWVEGEFIYVEQFTQLMHFYHINHLDYMGLIPMGLAIDATGLNIY